MRILGLAFLLVACSSAPSGPTDTCSPSCLGGCAADETCFGGEFPNISDVHIGATCRKRCTTTDDCAAGQHCVLDGTLYGQAAGAVCLPDDLARCDSTVVGGCSSPPICDGDNLRRTYFQPSVLCGTEIVHCANGCDSGSCR